ncbi:MAG: hypothetical protein MUQ27_07765 [Acidimicrobiia bacterium]|nr:hypothetical protein [Acidimicrobiia bacterium]
MTTPSESTLRRRANGLGLRLARSGRRIVDAPRGWQLFDANQTSLVFGGEWGVSLKEIADELTERASGTPSP